MKTVKLFLSALLITGLALTSFCQTERGSFIFGTGSTIGFTSTNYKWNDNYSAYSGSESSTSSKFNINPSVGYFIVNGLAGGLNLNLIFTSSKQENNKDASTYVGFGPFVRYYFGKDKIKPLLQGGFGFAREIDKSEYSGAAIESKYSQNINYFEFDTGLAYFINEKISLDVIAGYNSTTQKQKNDNSTQKNTAQNIGLGLAFNFLFL